MLAAAARRACRARAPLADPVNNMSDFAEGLHAYLMPDADVDEGPSRPGFNDFEAPG